MAATYTEQHKQKKYRQTSMLRVGFEPAIPVFEWEKTFGASDSAIVYILLAHYPLLIYKEHVPPRRKQQPSGELNELYGKSAGSSAFT
jgi:hypothetical protein